MWVKLVIIYHKARRYSNHKLTCMLLHILDAMGTTLKMQSFLNRRISRRVKEYSDKSFRDNLVNTGIGGQDIGRCGCNHNNMIFIDIGICICCDNTVSFNLLGRILTIPVLPGANDSLQPRNLVHLVWFAVLVRKGRACCRRGRSLHLCNRGERANRN